MSLGQQIVEAVEAHKVRKARVYPCHVNRASEIGHPCMRYLVYCRTAWEQKALPDIGLQSLFDEGVLHEDAVLRELAESGIRVIEQQRAWNLMRDGVLLVTGHIDAIVEYNGQLAVLEVKSMSPYIWQRTNSIADMQADRKIWLRKYPAQMVLYIHGTGLQCGVMALKNKVTGRLKCLDCEPSPAMVAALSDKAADINALVDAGTIPDRREWEEEVCAGCAFLTVCLPDRDFGPGATVLDDERLEHLLNRREECAQAKRDYDAITKQIKAGIPADSEVLVGDWVVTTKGRLNIRRRSNE